MKTNSENLRKLVITLLLIVFGGAIWGGFNTYANNVNSSEIEHIKEDDKAIKEDFNKKIDKLEENLNEKINTEINRVIRAIEKLHGQDHKTTD